MSPVLIQLIGYAAGATCSCCFIAKKDVQLRLAIFVGVSLYAWQYSLLGAHTASALNVVMAAWQLLAIFSASFSKRTRYVLLVLVCAVSIGGGLATWQGLSSLCPVVSNCWLAIACMFLVDRKLRFALLACDALWLVTGILTHSQGAVVFSILPLLLNCWYLYQRRAVATGTAAAAIPAPVALSSGA